MTQSAFWKAVIAVALSVAAFLPNTASAFLRDWRLNPDGTGSAGSATISEFLDFVGVSYIQQYTDAARTIPLPAASPVGTPFFFKENAAFRMDTHDFGSALGGTHFITALATGAMGQGVLGSTLAFNPDTRGVLNIYSDSLNNAASTAGIYGVNDGTLIGSFTQIGGCQACFVDATGLPTGAFAIFFKATSVASGYWFDSLGNELQPGAILGFATVNASFVNNPSVTAIAEIVGELAGGLATYTNTPATDFLVSTNGQFRLNDNLDIPEPGAVALFGLGLIGLGTIRCRRAR